ncbi:MAG TPA: helix-turn-helix transcriptional regulator [Verrucomicrobiae bacterium]|nr:helix-turn-helix transcriptional regulator [Verrucomicrobiae bacterium]
MSLRLEKITNWHELARQTNWSVAALARHCGVSGESLRQHFLKHMKKPPGAWLAEQRQFQAIELLRDGSSIKEASASLGYKQQTNFTRKFKEYWGACPSMPPPVQPASGQNLRK